MLLLEELTLRESIVLFIMIRPRMPRHTNIEAGELPEVEPVVLLYHWCKSLRRNPTVVFKEKSA